jgi:hypothetical protein
MKKVNSFAKIPFNIQSYTKSEYTPSTMCNVSVPAQKQNDVHQNMPQRCCILKFTVLHQKYSSRCLLFKSNLLHSICEMFYIEG